ncbi:MAG: hypothetical protein IPP94_05155 [Ignavibacteria bacterium]|nr:hypothetical protein [Ignavibacteria bacterium]
MKNSVVIDPSRGEMSIGDIVVPVGFSGSTGDVQVFPPAGPVLRPLSFGERYRVVERAAFAPDAAGSLLRSIVERATVVASRRELGDGERRVCEALALHLAGADSDAPCFADSMLLLAGTCGWSYDEIEHVEAARVDRLARRIQPAAGETGDGWNRVVFAPREATDVETIARALAMRLLERLDDSPFASATTQPGFGGSFSSPSIPAGSVRPSIESMAGPGAPARVRGGMPDVRGADVTEAEGIGAEAPFTAASAPGAAKVLAVQTRRQPPGQRSAPHPFSPFLREQLPETAREHPAVRLLRGSMATASPQAPAPGSHRERATGTEQLSSVSPLPDAASESGTAAPLPVQFSASPSAGDARVPPIRRVPAQPPVRSRLDADSGVTTAWNTVSGSARIGDTTTPSRSNPGRGRLPEARDMPFPARDPMEEMLRGSAASDRRNEAAAWTGMSGNVSLRHLGDSPLFPNATAAAPAATEGGLAATPGQGLEGALMDIADALAELLSDEADLRGLDR